MTADLPRQTSTWSDRTSSSHFIINGYGEGYAQIRIFGNYNELQYRQMREIEALF